VTKKEVCSTLDSKEDGPGEPLKQQGPCRQWDLCLYAPKGYLWDSNKPVFFSYCWDFFFFFQLFQVWQIISIYVSFRIGLFQWFMVYSNPDDSQISESKMLFSRYIIGWRRDPPELNIHLNTQTCTHTCAHTRALSWFLKRMTWLNSMTPTTEAQPSPSP